MIGRLQGTLAVKQPPELLIDVQGVGYEVQMPMSCFYDLPNINEPVTIWTHLVVRDDAHLLFGFNTTGERALFRLLIKTQGVGPKLALTIMSSMSASEFLSAISQKATTTLIKIPGIGKKTAERLIVELEDKVKDFVTENPQLEGGLPLQTAGIKLEATHDPKSEALAALLALGYKPAQANKVLSQVTTEGQTVETIIRDALKRMM